MKTINTILIIMLVCITTNTNAQILKKLGKKAEKAVERTLEKKVEDKAERETDKAFDSTFNKERKSKKEKKSNSRFSNSNIQPASNYSFTNEYVLQIENAKRPTILTYYLSNNGDYFGTSLPDNGGMNMINVMDLKKKTMFMFMDNNGTKNRMSMSLDIEDMATNAAEDTNYSIKLTGNTKTILGYLAKEYEVKGTDMYGTVWITEQAGVTFSKAFYAEKSKKGVDKSWMSAINGLFLEISITDTSKKKPSNVKMKCISLKKTNFSINSSDYKKMM